MTRITSSMRMAIAIALVFACTLMAPSAAHARQDLTGQRPPTPSRTGEPPIILTFLLIGVLVAIGIGAQALPSKRGHQD
jgi:hypothetical protein